jgi:transcriptional regulator with XRE-family HTH domain
VPTFSAKAASVISVSFKYDLRGCVTEIQISHRARHCKNNLAPCEICPIFSRTCGYLRVAKRRTPYQPSRLVPVFREYLKEHVPKGKQTEIAKQAGIAGNTLSERISGERPASLEIVEKISAKKTGTAILTELRDIAFRLDAEQPGWDRPSSVDRVSVSELASRAGLEQPKSEAGQSSRDRSRRSGKRRT